MSISNSALPPGKNPPHEKNATPGENIFAAEVVDEVFRRQTDQLSLRAANGLEFTVVVNESRSQECFYKGGDKLIYCLRPSRRPTQSTGLNDGVSSIAFGTVNSTSSVTKTFTIRNTGSDSLSGIAVSKDGVDANDYSVDTMSMATTLAPSATTTFSVTFVPTASGAGSAAVHVASNVIGVKNPFDITLTGTGNTPPTDVALSSISIVENNAASAIVGTLTATDAGVSQTHTFALAGGPDDAAFTISGNTLSINSSADFEAKNSYAIRIRATDIGTLTFEKNFTVSIINALEPVGPIAVNDAVTATTSSTTLYPLANDGNPGATIASVSAPESGIEGRALIIPASVWSSAFMRLRPSFTRSGDRLKAELQTAFIGSQRKRTHPIRASLLATGLSNSPLPRYDDVEL